MSTCGVLIMALLSDKPISFSGDRSDVKSVSPDNLKDEYRDKVNEQTDVSPAAMTLYLPIISSRFYPQKPTQEPLEEILDLNDKNHRDTVKKQSEVMSHNNEAQRSKSPSKNTK